MESESDLHVLLTTRCVRLIRVDVVVVNLFSLLCNNPWNDSTTGNHVSVVGHEGVSRVLWGFFVCCFVLFLRPFII